MKKKIIIFANTLWFLEKFKFDLISSLLIKNNVECLYLRSGPSFDERKVNLLKNKNVKFNKVEGSNYFYKSALTIPLHAKLNQKNIIYIVKKISHFFKNKS